MSEKYCCGVCDKAIQRLTKYQHEKTKSHIQVCPSVVNRFLIESAKVEDIDQNLQKHVIEYNKKKSNI